MAYLEWSPELDTGIQAIDRQHRKIVDYINQLHDARLQGDRGVIGEVINGLVDYTQSHFVFEEQMMEDAGYPLSRGHKRIHESFIKRVAAYQQRFEADEDVAEELHDLLKRWLYNHIKHDDACYVDDVLGNIEGLRKEPAKKEEEESWVARSLRRIFGR